MLWRISFLYLFLSSFVCADDNSVMFDRNFSPYSGAENFIAMQKGLEKVEDRFFSHQPISDGDIKNPLPPLPMAQQWGQWWRNLIFWAPISLSMSVTQHEVFGHGYRIRDLGPKYATVEGYKMYVIGGSTRFEPTQRLTPSQMITMDIAGLEADSVFSNRMRSKWLKNGAIDPRQITLYLTSTTTSLMYSMTVNHTSRSRSEKGNDISNYLFYLNALYPDGHVSYRSLRNLSWLNLVDPFIFLSFYSLSMYERYGTSPSLPMFQFGKYMYLPVVRTALTPFGLQGVLENYFLTDTHQFTAYLKWGKNGPNSYFGTGIERQKLAVFPWVTAGARLDFWYQPNVLFSQGALSAVELMELSKNTPVPKLYPDEVLNEKEFGFLASVIGTLGKESWPTRPYFELGYKTKGYLPGEALRAAPIMRLGLSGNF